MKLTKKVADSVEASEKDVWVWDGPMPGFGLRVMPSSIKGYLVQYRDADGEPGV